ncbi:Uncharacterised protein [Legionella donaldsonii]|uniref:Uncharacterized protein n=1 Tax=Legionella donaldsonii TaxID=45060 RepID=A0A378J7Z9_9GAMM|nr:Uncharacterised protein [Legionella donaldsonii]
MLCASSEAYLKKSEKQAIEWILEQTNPDHSALTLVKMNYYTFIRP